jgi:hypothetical protein
MRYKPNILIHLPHTAQDSLNQVRHCTDRKPPPWPNPPRHHAGIMLGTCSEHVQNHSPQRKRPLPWGASPFSGRLHRQPKLLELVQNRLQIAYTALQCGRHCISNRF